MILLAAEGRGFESLRVHYYVPVAQWSERQCREIKITSHTKIWTNRVSELIARVHGLQHRSNYPVFGYAVAPLAGIPADLESVPAQLIPLGGTGKTARTHGGLYTPDVGK